MKKYLYIIILSVIAIINASYLSYKAYYFMFVDPSGLTTICDISKTISCGDVLQHPLSRVFGIPFPWIALVVYPIILGLAVYAYRTRKKIHQFAYSIQIISLLGMIFNGFIISREILYIHKYCLLCMICSVIIMAIFVLSTMIKLETKKK